MITRCAALARNNFLLSLVWSIDCAEMPSILLFKKTAHLQKEKFVGGPKGTRKCSRIEDPLVLAASIQVVQAPEILRNLFCTSSSTRIKSKGNYNKHQKQIKHQHLNPNTKASKASVYSQGSSMCLASGFHLHHWAFTARPLMCLTRGFVALWKKMLQSSASPWCWTPHFSMFLCN